MQSWQNSQKKSTIGRFFFQCPKQIIFHKFFSKKVVLQKFIWTGRMQFLKTTRFLGQKVENFFARSRIENIWEKLISSKKERKTYPHNVTLDTEIAVLMKLSIKFREQAECFFTFFETVEKFSNEKQVFPQEYLMEAWNTKNFPPIFHAECKFSDSDKRRPKFFTMSENDKYSCFWKKKDFSSKRSGGQVKRSFTTRWNFFASRPKHFDHSFSGNEKEKYLVQKTSSASNFSYDHVDCSFDNHAKGGFGKSLNVFLSMCQNIKKENQ